MSGSVVQLDHALLCQAELLATGANAHRLRNIVHLYVNIVWAVNHGAHDHVVEAEEIERNLRNLVATERRMRFTLKRGA